MPTVDHKLRVFLCHASQDKPIVRDLCQRLTDEGWIDPWLEEGKLLPGEDWRASIEEAVEVADLVIICLSNNSVNKEGFVQKELRYAREISLEKPEGSIFLIPVRFDECAIPRGLRFIQWTNYFGEDKEKSYSSLLEIFRKRYLQVHHREDDVSSNTHKSLKKEPQPIMSVLSDYFDQVDNFASHPDSAYGVPTGFIDLDVIMNGLKPSNFFVIGSYDSQHKTNFLLSILRNAALIHKKHIAVFLPLGFSNKEMVQHLIAQETGIDLYRLSMGKLTEHEWPLFTHAVEVIGDTHIFLDDSSALTLRHIKEKSRQLALENQIDLIIIDNLQFISRDENFVSPSKDINHIDLKVLSRELNIPILAGVHLKRTMDTRLDKRPQLSDLREFGQLEDLADVIMFIRHPDLYEVDFAAVNLAEVIVAKQNFGRVGIINLVFRSNLGKYENAVTRVLKNEDKKDE